MTESERLEQTKKVVDSLNEAWAADPEALRQLLCYRVRCNDAFAGHPTIVCEEEHPGAGTYRVGALGLINGVLGALGLPRAAAKFSDQDETELQGFQLYAPAEGSNG